jgi:CHASE2 domain-containing sensor protein
MSSAPRSQPLYFTDAIVVISSCDVDDDEQGNFGTGFIIDHDDKFTYVLTCAHVVADTVTDGQVQVNGYQGVVEVSGQAQGIDLAVLKVAAFQDTSPISLATLGDRGVKIQILGYYGLDDEGKQARRPIDGKLDKAFEVVTAQGQGVAKAWDLLIEDKDPLKAGYSGAPVIDLATGCAVGVVTHRIRQGEEGHALSIDGLTQIWPRGHALLTASVPSAPDSERLSASRKLLTPLSALPKAAITSSAIAAFVTVVLRFFGAFEFLELQFYDHALTTRPPEPISDRIVIVETTAEDYDAQSENNEERTLTESISDDALLETIHRLREYGASVIAIDMYLAADSQPWSNVILASEDTEAEITALELFQSLPEIYGVCGQLATGYPDIPTPYQEAVPLSRVGISNFQIDVDGVLRRHLIKHTLTDQEATLRCRSELALSILVAFRYLEVERPSLTPLTYAEALNSVTQNNLSIGDVIVNRINSFDYGGYYDIDPRGFQLLLKYRSPEEGELRDAFPRFSIQDVRQMDLSSAFENKIVLIGFTDNSRANDRFLTPYGETLGVTLQAHMIDQIVSTVLDERRLIWVWPSWQESIWVMIWALVGGLGGYYLKQPKFVGIFILVGSGGIYLAALLTMWMLSGWIPMAPALMAFAGANVWVIYQQRHNLLIKPN